MEKKKVENEPKEIKKLIERGESETLEFKESFDKEATETAVAFANTRGGIILIGINRQQQIAGTSVGKETLKDWINEISQATEPAILPEIESQVLENKVVVIITIKESPIKPVSYKGVCYRRIANSNKKLPPKEIAEMHLQTIGSSWDSYPAQEATLKDLDLEKVKGYIKSANETGRRKIKETPLLALRKIDLIKKEKPTWTAILLFGKEPQRFVLQARIHCGKFKQTKVEILDDKMIEGNLIDQVDGAMEFIKKHLRVRFVISGKPQREEIWEYPLEAVREAVINALVHRDYTESGETQIAVYDDRLEIWNPGGLPLGMSIEDLYKEEHKSIPRNKMIAQIFYDIKEVEKYGSGTTRMISLCRKERIYLQFQEIFSGFAVVFRKNPYTEEYLKGQGLNERQIRAVMFIKEEGKISNQEYQRLGKVSKKTASRELLGLTQSGILKRRGVTGKGTAYTLEEQRGQKGVRKGSEKRRVV